MAGEVDTVVIGSGISGTLVTRELLRRGEQVVMVERGSVIPWERQLELAQDTAPPIVEGTAPTARHNDENAPDGVDWRWEYVYALGGSCNHWVGVSPRLLPEDFKMRTTYGVFRDWPIDYDELSPYYEEAERAMAVSGSANELMPGGSPPLPAHPFSPQDRALAAHMQPFIHLRQARPSRPVGSRPACCGSMRCEQCPVDSRFSVLNSLNGVLRDPALEVRTETIAARLVPRGRRIDSLECIDAKGERLQVRASRYVVAANAIESAGLLLRSDLKTNPATGRYFSSREAQTLVVHCGDEVHPGYGTSRSTGASYAYYSGPHRRHRSAAMLAVENGGRPEVMLEALASGLARGASGDSLRDEAVRRWRRAAVFSVVIEDEPVPTNAITLSSRKDAFGLPLNRVRYQPGEYEKRTFAHLLEDVPRRLRALGAKEARLYSGPVGAHLLGTLRMGPARDSVVDSDLRHHHYENLWVAGGAVFPTYSATHPTLTIAALAIRLGRHLAGA